MSLFMSTNSQKNHYEYFFTDEFDQAFVKDLSEILAKSGITEKQWNDLEPNIKLSIHEGLRKSAHLIVKTLHEGERDLIIYRHLENDRFFRVIEDNWRKPLNLLEAFIHSSIEIGYDLNEKHRNNLDQDRKHTVEAITRLHGRACQVSQEILLLLQNGFPDGAFARWRTLHEIAVVAFFLQTYGDDIAKKYLLHEACQSHAAMEQYRTYSKVLGNDEIRDIESLQLQSLIDRLNHEYGSLFSKPYGWANDVIREKNPKKQRFTFSDIEEIVQQDFIRPYYKLASYSIHAEAKGILFNLSGHKKDVIPAGPSIFGLEEPGQNTAISLLKINHTILSFENTFQKELISYIFQELCDEICQSFIITAKEVNEKDRVYSEKAGMENTE